MDQMSGSPNTSCSTVLMESFITFTKEEEKAHQRYVNHTKNEHLAPCKEIRILDSEKFFLWNPKFLECFSCGIRSPGLSNPESSSRSPLTIGIRNPSSSVGSFLAGEVFLRFLCFFPLVNIQHLQVSIRYRTHGHV